MNLTKVYTYRAVWRNRDSQRFLIDIPLPVSIICCMHKKYSIGQEVTVNSSQGPLVRVVVEDLGEIITICRKGELEMAAAENRHPTSVGFRKTDILEDRAP